MYMKQIESYKNKIFNKTLKTHVGARVCNNMNCINKNNVIITTRYTCYYCEAILKTLEGSKVD